MTPNNLIYSNHKLNKKNKLYKLPFLVWLVIVSTIAAFYGGRPILGYNISGYAWVLPLSFAILKICSNPSAIRSC